MELSVVAIDIAKKVFQLQGGDAPKVETSIGTTAWPGSWHTVGAQGGWDTNDDRIRGTDQQRREP